MIDLHQPIKINSLNQKLKKLSFLNLLAIILIHGFLQLMNKQSYQTQLFNLNTLNYLLSGLITFTFIQLKFGNNINLHSTKTDLNKIRLFNYIMTILIIAVILIFPLLRLFIQDLEPVKLTIFSILNYVVFFLGLNYLVDKYCDFMEQDSLERTYFLIYYLLFFGSQSFLLFKVFPSDFEFIIMILPMIVLLLFDFRKIQAKN